MGWILRKWREYRLERLRRLQERRVAEIAAGWVREHRESQQVPEEPAVAPDDGSPRAIHPKYQTWVYPGEDGWPFD